MLSPYHYHAWSNSRVFAPFIFNCMHLLYSGRTLMYCRCFSSIKAHMELGACVVDGLLLLLLIAGCLIGSIAVEQAFKFTCVSGSCGEIQYYTINSFFLTYLQGESTVSCVSHNPTSTIRASLAMLYFSMFFCFLSFQMSVKSFRRGGKENQPTAVVVGSEHEQRTTGSRTKAVGFRQLPTAETR